MTPLTEALNFSLEQGLFYLENVNEFYPFGTIVDKNGKIVPISVQTDSAHPEPVELINLLEVEINNRLQSRDIMAGVIGVDVYINLPHKPDKRVSAIELRGIDISGLSFNWYKPYVIVDEVVYYRDVYVEEGTFKLDRNIF
jgi:hypothetical protein